jgi:5-hydroxyisourate hydrolase
MKSPITTHVLDTTRGTPVSGMEVILELHASGREWREVARGTTDSDGRINNLISGSDAPAPGIYRLVFQTGVYFRSMGTDSFYPFVQIVFELHESSKHYHVPLLISPFGYSTYRGS